jgi:hypothetical protein
MMIARDRHGGCAWYYDLIRGYLALDKYIKTQTKIVIMLKPDDNYVRLMSNILALMCMF